MGGELRAWMLDLNVNARGKFIVAGLITVLALALMLPAVQVCRDWAFIDRNTGSRKGYREWLLGWRTGSWYQESALEKFIRTNEPAELKQDWVSYAGTGRNIFGGATLYGHGRPGPIDLLNLEVIDGYCRVVSDAQKRQFYDALASGDEEKIRKLVDEIYEVAMKPGTSEPNGAAHGSQQVPSGTKRMLSATGSSL